MIYLSGKAYPGWGYIQSPEWKLGAKPRRRLNIKTDVWAADNGCFTKPDLYNDDDYIEWLTSFPDEMKAQCLWATAPDIVGDAEATISKFWSMESRIRNAGYRVALVAQDGMESIDIPWDLIDCIFVGGTTDWKLSDKAARLIVSAKVRGKWVHMGRVNSKKRLLYAAKLGCDSADGTFLAFGPTVNEKRLTGWIRSLDGVPHSTFFAVTEED